MASKLKIDQILPLDETITVDVKQIVTNQINSLTANTTPVDEDLMYLGDSTATFGLRKLSWANIKTALTSIFISKVTTPTTNALGKIDANGNIVNSNVIIDDSGNMGINNNNPLQKLHVVGNILASDTTYKSENTLIGAILNNNHFTPSLDIRRFNGTGTNHGVVKIAGNAEGDMLFFSDTKNTNTEATTERMRIYSNGNVLVTNVGGLGYGTGAGGTVTQLTSKSTAVTLNKPTGQIIMNNAALAPNTIASFQFLNSLITTSDMVIVTLNNKTDSYNVWSGTLSNGSCFIDLKNIAVSSYSESVIINFAIIKGANA